MTTPTQRRFVLPPDLIAALGAITTTTPNALSPTSAAPIADDVRQRLVQCAVLDQSGRVTEAFGPILQTLNAPTGVAHVQLTGGTSIIEFQIYTAGNVMVSAMTSPQGLEVTSPAEVGEAVRTLTEHLGFSLLSRLTISAQLPVADALVFAALVDFHRRRQLEALLSGSPATPERVDVATIKRMLDLPDPHPQWLVAILSMATGTSPATIAPQAEALFNRFSPDILQAAEQLATRFSIIDKVFTMTSAALGADGSPVVSQMSCLQAGVHDLLVIEPGTDAVGFLTLPSSMILSRIAAILADPSGELSTAVLVDERPAGAPATEEHFCSHCGTQYRHDSQFCTSCGHPRSPTR